MFGSKSAMLNSKSFSKVFSTPSFCYLIPTVCKRNFGDFPDPRILLNEEQVAIQDSALSFATKKMKGDNPAEPLAGIWDEKEFFPIEVMRESAELGFGGLYVDEEYGGMGVSRLDGTVVFEALSSADVSTATYISIHNMCAGMINKYAKKEIKDKYLEKITTMELFTSYCLTEPNAGSDAGNLSTKAIMDGDHYVLNGSKAFISGGGDTDIYVVMVRTGGPGPKGISTLVVDKNEVKSGLSFGNKEKKLGWKTQPTRMVMFDNCRIPKENLLGNEGDGFKIAMEGLDGGRLNIAASSVGSAQECFTIAKNYVKDRKQFGKSLSQFQDVQFKLADMATEIHASRLLVRQAAIDFDTKNVEATTNIAMAKRYACDNCHTVIDKSLQLLGGYGYLKDYQIERHLRDTRVHRILEGTDAVMKLITSRRALRD